MKTNKISRKIFILAGITFGAIIIFWYFIYIPKNKALEKMEAELTKTQNDVKEIQDIITAREDLNILINDFSNQVKKFRQILPVQEETTLRELARRAVNMQIEVLAIKPQPAEETKLPVQVPCFVCQELNIEMQLKTSYQRFGEYLAVVEGDFPTIIKLKSLRISKEQKSKDTADLLITLKIALYMLIPER